MGKFFYANTHNADLLNYVNDKGNGSTALEEITYLDKKWIRIPYNIEAGFMINPKSLSDFYYSAEIVPIPKDFSKVYKAEMPNGNTLSSYVRYYTSATDSVTDYSLNRVAQVNDGYYTRYYWDWLYEHHGDGNWLPDMPPMGSWGDKYDSYGSSYANVDVLKAYIEGGNILKVYYHNKVGGQCKHISSIQSGIVGARAVPFKIAFQGVYLRNLIVSEEPITFSDTVQEVDVESITGDGWAKVGDKYTTQFTNATATLKVNVESLAKAKTLVDARKFGFCGTTSRTGDNINALDVAYGTNTSQQLVDYGDHSIGTAWDFVDGIDTLTLTTRRISE